MSILLRRAENYLHNRQFEIDPECLYVFCSDSKGNYLKKHIPYQYENNFIWYTQKGRNTSDGIDFVLSKVQELSKHHSKVVLFFWHGTCDVTMKEGKFIYLQKYSEEEFSQYFEVQYTRLQNAISYCHNVQLILLEAPPISAKKWNELRGNYNFDRTYDNAINQQINGHNKIIKNINLVNNMESPKFELDLVKSRKSDPNTPTQYMYNFFPLKDGVHPEDIIAKKWLYKIMEKSQNALT